MRRILVAGATGLIGNAVVSRLSEQKDTHVIALTRSALVRSESELEQWIAPDDDLLAGLKDEKVDAVICCLGTTIKKAGSQKKFRYVDHDLVIGLAEWAKKQEVPVFSVISAIGADAGSRVFYNRVKGEMERDLKALQLPALHIFQPSILVGPREEFRFGEKIGILFMQLFSPLMIGKWERYRPMDHDILAQALIASTEIPQSGTYTYTAIKALAGDQKLASRP